MRALSLLLSLLLAAASAVLAADPCDDLTQGGGGVTIFAPTLRRHYENCIVTNGSVSFAWVDGADLSFINVRWTNGSSNVLLLNASNLKVHLLDCRFESGKADADFFVVRTTERTLSNVSMLLQRTNVVLGQGGSALSAIGAFENIGNVRLTAANGTNFSTADGATSERGVVGILSLVVVMSHLNATISDVELRLQASRVSIIGGSSSSSSSRTALVTTSVFVAADDAGGSGAAFGEALSILIVRSSITVDARNGSAFAASLVSTSTPFVTDSTRVVSAESNITVSASADSAAVAWLAADSPSASVADTHGVNIVGSRIAASSVNGSALVGGILVSNHSNLSVIDSTFTAMTSDLLASSEQGKAIALALVGGKVSVKAAEWRLCASNVSASSAVLSAAAATGGVPVIAQNWTFYVIASDVASAPLGQCLSTLPNGALPSSIRDSSLRSCRGLSTAAHTTLANLSQTLFAASVRNASTRADITRTIFPAASDDRHAMPYGLINSKCPLAWLPSGVGLHNRDAFDKPATGSVTSSFSRASSASLVSSSTSVSVTSSQRVSRSTTHTVAVSSMPSQTTLLSRTVTAVRPYSTMPPPPPTPDPPRVVSGSVQLTILMPQQSADAIAVTATTSTVATAIVNPTAASKVSRVAAAMRILECALVSDDEEPSFVEMPLQAPLGDTNLRHFTGALLLTTTLLVALPFVAHGALWHFRMRRLKLLGAIHSITLQYFVPTCGAVIALLLSHGESGADFGVAVASAVAISVVVGITARRVVRYDDETDAAAMGTFVDGCANLAALSRRIYSLEELAVSTAVSVITGMRRGSCSGIALAVVIVMLAHLAYLLVIRPYRTKLDTFFSLLGGLLQLTLCILVAIVLLDGNSPATEYAIAVTLLLILVMWIIETLVTLSWSLFVSRRRKLRAALNDDDDAAGSQLLVPLAPGSSSSLASDSASGSPSSSEVSVGDDGEESVETGEYSQGDDSDEDDEEENGIVNPLANYNR